jgi:hypothetical protein
MSINLDIVEEKQNKLFKKTSLERKRYKTILR